MAELNTSKGVCIDVDDELAKSMSRKLEQLRQLEQPYQDEPLTIFKIPEYIRCKHKELYEPQIVSIGPYHRDAKPLKRMEEQKWQSLQQLLQLPQEIADQEKADQSLSELVKHVRSLEVEARSAYIECESLPESDEFVKMMVLDSCFIIQFLTNLDHKKVGSDISAIISDLLLLENQIPFFIIRTLYLKIFQKNRISDLYSLLANFMFTVSDIEELETPDEDPVHLVHLYYQWFLLTAKAPRTATNSEQSIPPKQRAEVRQKSPQLQPHRSYPRHDRALNVTFESGHHSLPEQSAEETIQHSSQLPPYQSSIKLPGISHTSTFQSRPSPPPKLEAKAYDSDSDSDSEPELIAGFLNLKAEDIIQHSPERPHQQTFAGYVYADALDTEHSSSPEQSTELQQNSPESSIRRSLPCSAQIHGSGYHTPPGEITQHSLERTQHQTSTGFLNTDSFYSVHSSSHKQNAELQQNSPEPSIRRPLHSCARALFSDCDTPPEEIKQHSPECRHHHTDSFFSANSSPIRPPRSPSMSVPAVKVTTTAPIKVIPSATTLRMAGVKFKGRTSRDNLFRVTFDKGVIEISSIILDNNRKRLLLNLIVLEQSQVNWKKDLTSFAKLMDMLIDTPKDVAILEKCGILHNLLASAEEATCFFNQICECAAVDYNNNYLDKLIQEVREFRNSKWHRYLAIFKRNHFNSPWSITSLIITITLLIITILQVSFAAYTFSKLLKKT